MEIVTIQTVRTLDKRRLKYQNNVDTFQDAVPTKKIRLHE